MEYSPKFLLLFLLLSVVASCLQAQQQNQKVYIVYFGEHSGEKSAEEIAENHHSYISSVKDSEEEARSSLIYSYKHSINGFAASLTAEQARKLSERDDVASVMPSRQYSLQTTRSWEFVGVETAGQLLGKKEARDDLLIKARYGRDVIAGLLDSGVWPESKSFSDGEMGPIPKRWKGGCQTGSSFRCSKKIIGARFYIKGYENYYGALNRTLDSYSPRDLDGHGTHTASTLGGNHVYHASAMGGFASGRASGGAPLARLAIYKVCWAVPGQEKVEGNTCFFEDMLAGIDDAIHDGVDVISTSIGSPNQYQYYQDLFAIGALHATKNNIVVSCSAGNLGPNASTLSNTAPWIITVSASSVDRAFIASVQLGNGQRLEGQTVTPNKRRGMHPLVRAAQVANSGVAKNMTDQCMPGSLDPEKAKGKIVVCLRGAGMRISKGAEVQRAGGVGYILGNNREFGESIVVDAHVLPATAVGYKNAEKILSYIASTKNPMAQILYAKTVYKNVTAPFMASFTSRGPNVISPDILKPDITAPGLNVLAAWSGGSSPTKLSMDKRRVKYNILSGTSMACPHVSGAAVLLKAIHPTWSSAAIRSAIMTTAGLINNKGHPITDASGKEADPFQYGSGHFRPSKAADPGLVYDASYEDYALFVCNFNNASMVIPGFACPKNPPRPGNLNYPSIQVPQLKKGSPVVIKRTVTNVGASKSVYFASMKAPAGVSMKISPPILHFQKYGEKKSFTVTFRAESEVPKGEYIFGHYSWSDATGIYKVRSPVAVASA